MKVSIDWLSDYIDVPGDINETADILTMAGLEVECVENRQLELAGVISSRVEEVRICPGSDNLNICTLMTDMKSFTVVCGDKDVSTGEIVSLALPGATMSDGRVIKRSKIKGVESDGMLCSEKDLGITEDDTGVMRLPKGTEPGMPISKVLMNFSLRIDTGGLPKRSRSLNGYSDSIFEVGLTPNRPDCLSIFGIARELSAITGKTASCPEISLSESSMPVEEDVEVEIREPDKCLRYTARVLKGVLVGKSPLWLRQRLEASGVRSINNVVDITNYVMLELGQPMHAFDLRKVEGNRIIVRDAMPGESLKTLDGAERSFSAGELLICDRNKPLALAGIIGGEESSVTADTRDILLESAYFLPVTVRKTSKKLGVSTESSYRFERGVDIEGVKKALDRAAMLIEELAGGELCAGSIDNYPSPYMGKIIRFRPGRCRDLLGIALDDSSMIGYLEALEMRAEPSGEGYNIEPPSYRVDIVREADLIEEVARLHGYSSIPEAALAGCVLKPDVSANQFDILSLKRFMTHSGYDEAVNYSFHSPLDAEKLLVASKDHENSLVRLLNPISEDLSIMRFSLIPGLINTAAINIKRQNRALRLFEIGKVFTKEGDEIRENLRICALMTGNKAPLLWKSESDIYDLKGTVENLLDLLGLRAYTWKNKSARPYLHTGRGAALFNNDSIIADIGEMHPSVLENYDIRQRVFVFELDLDSVKKISVEKEGFKDLPNYPFIERDAAFLADERLALADILTSIEQFKSPYLARAEVFDQFAGKGIEDGKKSLAVRFRYLSDKKTLTDQEVTDIHNSLLDNIVNECGVSLR